MPLPTRTRLMVGPLEIRARARSVLPTIHLRMRAGPDP